MANIPSYIMAMAEESPAEDLGLDILRTALPGINVVTQVSRDTTFPLVLVRRTPNFLGNIGDIRFLDSVDLAISTFTQDPDGDRDGAILSGVCKVVLRDAWLKHYNNPAIGSVTFMEVISPPRRVPDWATSTGPVQYADLPSNVWRHEARYRLVVRKPRVHPYS